MATEAQNKILQREHKCGFIYHYSFTKVIVIYPGQSSAAIEILVTLNVYVTALCINECLRIRFSKPLYFISDIALHNITTKIALMVNTS